MPVTVTINHTEAEVNDLFEAVHNEGYIGYWGDISPIGKNYFDAPYFVVVAHDEPTEPHYLHIPSVLKAFGEIASGKHVNRRIAKDALTAITGDLGQLDADVADAVIQVACFGELVYG